MQRLRKTRVSYNNEVDDITGDDAAQTCITPVEGKDFLSQTCSCHGSTLVGCRVGAGGGAADPDADVVGRALLVVVSNRLVAAVPGLEAPPRGGRAPFTGGVSVLLPGDGMPGLDACGGEGAPEEPAEPPDIASCNNHVNILISR
jgi:hypothetical protein